MHIKFPLKGFNYSYKTLKNPNDGVQTTNTFVW